MDEQEKQAIGEAAYAAFVARFKAPGPFTPWAKLPACVRDAWIAAGVAGAKVVAERILLRPIPIREVPRAS